MMMVMRVTNIQVYILVLNISEDVQKKPLSEHTCYSTRGSFCGEVPLGFGN